MKKIKILLVLILSMFINTIAINALGINASRTVYVNSNVAVTVDASGLIGKFSITSSNSSVLAGGDTVWLENQRSTFYFTAKAVGSATITVTPIDVSDTNGNEVKGGRSVTIKVVKKSTAPSIDVNKVYSKNNFLKSLSVEGYNLTPEFNKETQEYKLELEPGTEKINVIATKEDQAASIKGSGEIEITEGINTINIVVTAENGNERTYKIIANVEEKDPINVTVGKNKYTVVKKAELLPQMDNLKKGTVKIQGFDIPTYENEVTNITLVGLKDSEGKIRLFSYDSKTGEYKVYKEYSFDKMNLYIHEDKNSTYESVKIKINDEEVIAYKIEGLKDYYLLYATNTITGNEDYYLYDTKENSVQRYNTDILDRVTEEKNKYFSVVLVLSCVSFLSMLFLLIEINKKEK